MSEEEAKTGLFTLAIELPKVEGKGCVYPCECSTCPLCKPNYPKKCGKPNSITNKGYFCVECDAAMRTIGAMK